MFITSKPQKLLIALSTVLFVAGLLPFGWALSASVQNLLPKPVTIVASSTSPLDAQGQPLNTGALYDELINQASGNAVLKSAGNTFVTTAGTQVKVGDRYVNLETGVLFVRAEQLIVNLGDAKLELKSVSGILDVAKSLFILTDGQLTIAGQEIGPTNAMLLSAGGNTITSFDRAQFNSDSTYSQLISYMVAQQLASENLKDLSAPELTELSPASGSSTEDSKITLTGKSEPGIKLTIGGREVALDSDGRFELTLDLVLGGNTVDLVATDQYGNSATLTYTITRTTPPEPCRSGAFKADLICLINQYRESNGLNALREDVKLSTTASDHSDWMSANGTLSHTGINSSAPWDRCNSHGTTCDSETLAMNSSPTANNIFNQWRNSSDHNAILLGSHNFIGIGITSGYVTGVFR